MTQQPTYNRLGKKNGISVDVGSADFYKYFCKVTAKKYNVSRKTFTAVLKEFHEQIMKLIIYKKYDYKMPSNLGNIYIVSSKVDFRFDENGEFISKGMRVDYKATKDLWARDPKSLEERQKVFHFNEHYGRRNVRFYYDKRSSFLKNQSAYIFRASRKWKRELAKAIKSEDFDIVYYETPTKKK